MKVAPAATNADTPRSSKASLTVTDVDGGGNDDDDAWDEVTWHERPLPSLRRAHEEEDKTSRTAKHNYNGHDDHLGDVGPHPSRTVIEAVLLLKRWEVIAADGKESLKLSGAIQLYWRDDRLDGFPSKRLSMPASIWRPQVMANAGFDIGPAEKGEQMPLFYHTRSDGTSDGTLVMECPISLGEDGHNLSGDVDLRAFPFDSTRVDLSVCFIGRQRKETDRDIALSLRRPQVQGKVEQRKREAAQIDGYQQFDLDGCSKFSNDHELVGVSLAVGGHEPPNFLKTEAYEEGDLTVDLLISLHIRRSYAFYYNNSIVPLYTIAVFGCVSFALEPSGLSDRVNLCSVLFLSIYAVQWSTIGHLPRLPYKTIIDSVSTSINVVIGIILTGSCAAYHIARPPRDCADIVGDGDASCAFDHEKADVVDWVCAVVVVAYVLVYSVGYRTVYAAWSADRRNGASRPWTRGSYLRNKRFRPIEGYHLKVDAAFIAKHGKKFLGQGERVADPETW